VKSRQRERARRALRLLAAETEEKIEIIKVVLIDAGRLRLAGVTNHIGGGRASISENYP
jgi:hypothetical protein